MTLDQMIKDSAEALQKATEHSQQQQRWLGIHIWLNEQIEKQRQADAAKEPTRAAKK